MDCCRWIAVLAAFLLLCPALPMAAASYQGPDDPEADRAADQAVQRLGPDRGGLHLVGRTITITGFGTARSLAGLRDLDIRGDGGRSFKGMSREVRKTLTDLGAKTVGHQIRLSLSGDVLFDFDRWDVRKEAEEKLYKLARAVNKLQEVEEILIEGHTDAKGSEAYNLKLSRLRAESISRWLQEKGGLAGARFVTVGYGESRPVAPNTREDGSDYPEGRAKNRRVEITVKLRQST